MCKKSLLSRIKTASKSLSNTTNTNIELKNVKSNIVQKRVQLSKHVQNSNVKQAFEKTKEQFNKKQQTIKLYAEKAKQATENKAKSFVQSTMEYKNKILSKESLEEKKQIIGKYTDKIKQKAMESKQSISVNTEKALQATKNFTLQKKQSLSQIVTQTNQKLKDSLTSGKSAILDKVQILKDKTSQLNQKIKQIQIVKNTKDNISSKLGLIEKKQKNEEKKMIGYSAPIFNKQQIQNNSQIEKNKNEYKKQDQSKNKNNNSSYSFFNNFYDKAQQWNNNLFQKIIVKQTKNIFIRMLTSLYWRVLFLIGFGIILWNSHKFLAQYRQFVNDAHKRQLQKNKHDIQMQKIQKGNIVKVDYGVQTQWFY